MKDTKASRTKRKLLLGAAFIAALSAPQASYAVPSCGTSQANGNGGLDYTVSGNDTVQCILSNNDTLNVTKSGELTVEDSNAIEVLNQSTGGITINGNVSTQVSAGNNSAAIYLNALYLENSTVDFVNNLGTVSANVSQVDLANDVYVGAYGIRVLNASTVTNKITNSGLINIDASSEGKYADIEAYGIYATDNSSSSIINSGTIKVKANATGHGDEAAIGAHGIRVDYGGTFSEIENSGKIIIDSFATDTVEDYIVSRGIWFADASLTGSVKNSGSVTITATSEAPEGEVYVRGINLRDNVVLGGDVINSGSVNVTIDAGYEGNGVGIYVDESTVNGDIINSGTVRVSVKAVDTAESYGVNVYESTVSGALYNSGSIYAEATAPNAETYGVHVNQGQINGGIVNTGTISAGSGIAIYLEDLTGSTPVYLSGGRVIGDIIDNNPTNGFSNLYVEENSVTEGDYTVSNLNISNGKKFTISAGDTVTLSDMTTSAGGELVFGVNSAVNAGKLVVNNGNNIDLTGMTISALVSGNNTLADGDEILIADGATAINGGPGSVKTAITDNSYIWSFKIADGLAASAPTDNTQLYLFATQENTISSGASSNNSDIAKTVEGLSGSSNTQFAQFIGNINSASSASEVNDLLESAGPTTDAGSQVAASNMMTAMFDLADGQLAMVNTGGEQGVASGERVKGLHFWTQGFGNTADQGERGGVAGYDADTYGVAFGVDTRNFSKDTTLGLSFGYADTEVDSKNINRTKTEVNSYQLMAYANHDLKNDSFLTGMLAAAYGDNEQTRHNVGGVPGLTARADYDSWVGGLRASAGHNFSTGGNFKITPQVFTEYTHFKRDGFTESGAGGLNLKTGDANQDALNFGVSVQAEKKITLQNGLVIKPDVHVSYKYDVLDDKADTTSGFAAGGTSFETGGVNPADSTFTAGTGVKLYNASGWDFTANYDYTYKEDYKAHSGFLRAGYEF